MDVEVGHVGQQQVDEARKEESPFVELPPECSESRVADDSNVTPLVVPDAIGPIVLDECEVGHYREQQNGETSGREEPNSPSWLAWLDRSGR